MKETIEALEKLIQIKNETIRELEKQIQLLKNQPPQVITSPNEPLYPYQPYEPYNPLQPITTPIVNPQYPYPGTATTNDGTNIVFKSSDLLPPGSIQMGPCTITNISTSTLNSTDINHPSNQNITFTNTRIA